MTSPPRPILEADLHAFVDGQMDFERRSVIVQAMAADGELRAKIELWRRQNEALTATFGSVLREPLPLRLMPTNLVRAKAPTAPPAAAPSLVPPAARPVSALPLRAAAIALAAFVAGGAMMFIIDALTFGSVLTGTRPAQEVAATAEARPLALRAYEAHRTFATDLTHAVEVPATDEPRLLQWIQHRLSMAVRIPDLRRQGWTLLGGRVLPGELGPAAFLIYGDGVERLGVYLARTNARQTQGFSVYDNGAGLGSAAYWVDEPVGYAITTNRDAAWFDHNGRALRDSIEAQAMDNASAE